MAVAVIVNGKGGQGDHVNGVFAAVIDANDGINEDHHHRSGLQPLLPSTMTAIAAVNNKQQPLASGGCRH